MRLLRASLVILLALRFSPWAQAQEPLADCLLPRSVSVVSGLLQEPWPGFWVDHAPRERRRLPLRSAELETLQSAILRQEYDTAIEMLHASGRFREARALEAQLEQYFARHSGRGPPAIPGQQLNPSREGGVNTTFVLTFPNGLRGVFKIEAGKSANPWNEIGAYRLSRQLGTDLVPVTVPFTWNGQPGSLQLYIDLPTQARQRLPLPAPPERTLGEILLRRAGDLGALLFSHPHELAPVRVWDALISYNDRHKHNTLLGRGFRGRVRVHAIDHDGYAFQPDYHAGERGPSALILELLVASYRRFGPMSSYAKPEDLMKDLLPLARSQ
jgi:hypothetical protein